MDYYRRRKFAGKDRGKGWRLCAARTHAALIQRRRERRIVKRAIKDGDWLRATQKYVPDPWIWD